MVTTIEYLQLTPRTENIFQANTFTWVNNNYPELRGYFWHTPNEEDSSLTRILQAAKGVLPGVLDFLFTKPSLWFIELKQPGRSLTKSQEKFIQKMKAINVPCFVCYNPSEVHHVLLYCIGQPLY